jgi:hypothetical protein
MPSPTPNGSLIRVTGRIAESDGWLAVEDNGVGFDADRPRSGATGSSACVSAPASSVPSSTCTRSKELARP